MVGEMVAVMNGEAGLRANTAALASAFAAFCRACRSAPFEQEVIVASYLPINQEYET